MSAASTSDAAIGRLVGQMNADSYRMLVLVREFDDRFAWKKWSFKCCAEWVAWRCGISLSAAREKVRTAHALRALPAISGAFEKGRLSYSKVRALTRVAQIHDEDLLLAYALSTNVARVEERCRQILNVAPESVHHARRAWQNRSLTMWRDERRGLLRLTVEVPLDEGELIARALDCAVAAGETTADLDPDAIAESKGTAWRAQQADALVAVAKSYLDGGHGHEGGATADHHQVVIHADAKALCGGAGQADLPIDTVKRLLCDCSLVTVIEDENGNPLDVGRKQRTVSTPLRRALYARDRGCTFPGCHRKRYLDGHHLKHWINGGETNPDNLTLLCTYHHTMLHEGGFSIAKEADDALRFITADGRTIPRGGYRLEDFIDDDVGGADENPSRETHVRDFAPRQCSPTSRSTIAWKRSSRTTFESHGLFIESKRVEWPHASALETAFRARRSPGVESHLRVERCHGLAGSPPGAESRGRAARACRDGACAEPGGS